MLLAARPFEGRAHVGVVAWPITESRVEYALHDQCSTLSSRSSIARITAAAAQCTSSLR